MGWHAITLYSPTGEYLDQLRWKSIDCTLVEGDGGVLTVTLFPEYRDDIFQRDSRIAYLRAPGGGLGETGKLVGNTCWLVTHRARVYNKHTGQYSIVLTCQHPNDLLGRRVVAYNEGTTSMPGADKSDIGSDNMYDYVNENFVTATDTARNISSAHFVLDPRPSPTFGASIAVAGSYRYVKDILDEIVQSSAAQGAYVGYEVYVQQPPGPFRVRFYSQYRGTNRGLTSGQPLVISPFTAHMGAAQVREDWSSAVSFVYAGGAGKDDELILRTAEDTTLSTQSPFGRTEYFESFNTVDTAMLDSAAYKVLRDYRPRRQFVGDVAGDVVFDPERTSALIYDVDYTWGDIVGAQYQMPIYSHYGGQAQEWINYLFDCRVNPVHIQVARFFDDQQAIIDQKETTVVTLQSVESTGP